MVQIVTGMMVPKGGRRKDRAIRLFDPSTGRWLHMSAKGQTADATYAWRGTKAQARTLRDRAKIRGEDWPYRAELPEQQEGDEDDVSV